MATPTKSSSALITSQSVPAGSTVTSSALDLRTCFAAGVTIRVTTTTAPNAGPLITVNVSKNGTTWTQFQRLAGPASANSSDDYVVTLPDWASYAQVSVQNQDSGSVSITVLADAHTITGVS